MSLQKITINRYFLNEAMVLFLDVPSFKPIRDQTIVN
jgi:hypothetical protein